MRAFTPACALLCVFAFTATAPAATETLGSCFDRMTNAEQRDCLRDLYRDVSAELETAFARKIERTLSASSGSSEAENEKHAQAIRDSQTAWLAYRNAECGRVVAGPGRGGTGTPGWIWACFAEKTLQRIIELNTVFEQREHR